MFTIINNRHRIFVVVLLLLLVFAGNNSVAQSKSRLIKPLKEVKLLRGKYDIFVYLSGVSPIDDAISLRVPDGGETNKPSDLQATYFDVGFCWFYSLSEYVGINLSMGYRNERYAQDFGYNRNDGVYSNWLTFDANTIIPLTTCCVVGVHTDVFLNHSIKDGSYTYGGIYEDCFNSCSFCWYIGMFMRFSRLRLEIHTGLYPYTRLNANKIAQHNMRTAYVDRFYLDWRISYRLFTNGNRQTPFIILKH